MSIRPRSQPTAWHRLFGTLFISGAVIGMVGNGLHPHAADLDGAATVHAIAGNDAWVAIHLAIIVAILLVIGGLVGLAEEMTGTPGEPLARLGLVAAVLGGSVVTVSSAIDGFVMKALSVVSISATGTDGALALSISVAVKDVDFGIWSIGMLAFFGVAFACFGGAVVASRRYSGWFGWIAIVGATGSAAAALLQIAASGEVQAAETIFFASSLLLTLWTLALGILMWRRYADATVDTLSLASGLPDPQA
ncbi:MAG: DUF4386 family protein [Candidatus Limnocylindrales bacterium]